MTTTEQQIERARDDLIDGFRDLEAYLGSIVLDDDPALDAIPGRVLDVKRRAVALEALLADRLRWIRGEPTPANLHPVDVWADLDVIGLPRITFKRPDGAGDDVLHRASLTQDSARALGRHAIKELLRRAPRDLRREREEGGS